jgi:hypothetical protein
VVKAYARYPGQVLAAPPVAAMLGEGKPVVLILGAVLGMAGPEAEAVARAYAAGIPRGSLLALSVTELDGTPDGDELAAMYSPPLHSHSAADVARWLGGLGLLPPGVADVRVLAGGSAPEVLFPAHAPCRVIGAVARVA